MKSSRNIANLKTRLRPDNSEMNLDIEGPAEAGLFLAAAEGLFDLLLQE